VKEHKTLIRGRNDISPDVINCSVDANPKLEQIVCVDDGRSVTIGELDAMANQIAHWGLSVGLKKG
jgi:acyl-CoA synthetase (AMP-forming)/AMP-acid ligase II